MCPNVEFFIIHSNSSFLKFINDDNNIYTLVNFNENNNIYNTNNNIFSSNNMNYYKNNIIYNTKYNNILETNSLILLIILKNNINRTNNNSFEINTIN